MISFVPESNHQKEIPKYSGGEEEKLMIIPIKEDFYSFLPKIEEFLKKIIKELINKS